MYILKNYKIYILVLLLSVLCGVIAYQVHRFSEPEVQPPAFTMKHANYILSASTFHTKLSKKYDFVKILIEFEMTVSEKTSAYAGMKGDQRAILFSRVLFEDIVQNHNLDVMYFIIAHEYAHHILNHRESTPINEMEADMLAVKLLKGVGANCIGGAEYFDSVEMGVFTTHPPGKLRAIYIRELCLDKTFK